MHDGPLLLRSLWQAFFFPVRALLDGADVVLIPGGVFVLKLTPTVTISQNILPFDEIQIRKYGISFFSLKLRCIRLFQSYSFSRSSGVIFLTKYAKEFVVENSMVKISGPMEIIPHGVDSRFMLNPKVQRQIGDYSLDRPFIFSYVSTIDRYKNQIQVLDAVKIVRDLGFPIRVQLIGAANDQYLTELLGRIEDLNMSDAVKYLGSIPFERLHEIYHGSDGFIFASGCENMPNILLEAMASSLPIACSNSGPMPEILGEAGVYFDPENPNSIANALILLLNSPELRESISAQSNSRARNLSWQRSAERTFKFCKDLSR